MVVSRSIAISVLTNLKTESIGPGRQRLLALDGIRGLAIIGVLCTHAASLFQNRPILHLFSFGWLGVDLFFALSGFLITGILIDTKAAENRAQSFYARRILRIFPIYYLTVSIVIIAQSHWDWLRSVAEMQTWKEQLPYLLYFYNMAPIWHGGKAHETLLAHFWSLAVEEQFYFIWPFIVWRLTTRSIYKVCAVALSGTVALRIVLGMHFGFGVWMSFFTLTRADGLFVGSALAALFATRQRLSPRLLWAFASPAFLVLVAVAILAPSQYSYGGSWMYSIGLPAAAILFGVLIAFSLQSQASALTRFFRTGWMRNFGRYSYGLYVFHLPIYFLVGYIAQTQLHIQFPLPTLYALGVLAVMVAVSYAVAWVSFNYFEKAFLRLKRHFEPVYAADKRTVGTPASVKRARAGLQESINLVGEGEF